MNTDISRTRWSGLVGTVVVAGLLVLPSGIALGQEISAADPAAAAAPAADADSDMQAATEAIDAPASDMANQPVEGSGQPAGMEMTDEPAGEVAASNEPTDAPADTAADEEAVDSTAAAGATPAPATQATGISPIMIAVILAALFIVPVLVGNWAGKQLRMPDHSWKISVVLGTFAAAAVVLSFGEIKFGPDLAGGITLIYELANPETQAGPDGATQHVQQVPMGDLIGALKQRVDPTGTREVTIREYGPTAVEIIIPKTGPDALQFVKRRITEMGQLEFRITADPTQAVDRTIIEQAMLLPPSQTAVMAAGQADPVAEWVAYSEAEFGPPDQQDNRVVKRMAGETPEALVLIDSLNVTGEYLTSATKGVDERGGPAVNFSFDAQGAARFRELTSNYKPNPATGAVRYLGIVLDKRLIGAPSIRTTISAHGQISGGAMTEDEVDFIISILQAGRLPASLNKLPISEEIISPTLGQVTIEKGEFAITVSLITVLVFMLFYYRFSGVIACLALAANLLLLLAMMVLIKAAFTLPGMAGIVLTIGMSVDANVLIFERIREELERGAALRMAIRNGFSRATTTIVDANVTTLIAGVVLYAIGTDQIRGFAVTLILGIVMSMYTAIFCSRVVFDIAERRGWVKSLSMGRIVGHTNIDFLGKRGIAAVVSVVLIAIGIAGVVARGSSLLNIDFTGGSSVTFVLDQADKMPIHDVRDAMVKTELADKNLLIVQRGEDESRYTINTSDQSVDDVEAIIEQSFAGKLQTFIVEIGEVKPFTEGAYSGTEAQITVNDGPAFSDDDGIGHESLASDIETILQQTGHEGVTPIISNDYYRRGSTIRYKQWDVRLDGIEPDAAREVFTQFKSNMEGTPLFPLASMIGGRVSSEMQLVAAYALGASLLGIVAYIWLRFQKVIFGLAAVVALIHDVLVTVGVLALSAYVVRSVPALATPLQLDAFQISLPIVAALLTIIGYSLNDTIIVFDRIREVRGKSPDLTVEMINTSVNQTLSRTLLTSFTTWIVVVILYFMGGEGIHGFAFCLVVGVLVGTYSSIYIASPVLLWMTGSSSSTPASRNDAVGRAG